MCTTLTIVSIELNTFSKTISPSLYGVSKAECNTITVRLCVDPLCLELLYRFDRENNCLLRSKVLSLHSVKCEQREEYSLMAFDYSGHILVFVVYLVIFVFVIYCTYLRRRSPFRSTLAMLPLK